MRMAGDGRRKTAKDTSKPPWKSAAWRKMSRHARAIKFQTTYCIVPKGVGAGKPIRLAGFQKELLEEVLATSVSSAVTSFPRGNGKSTLGAGTATWAVFDDDETGAPQVPIVATTVGQAIRSVYGVASQMIGKSPELANRCIPYTGTQARIVVPFNDGEMFPIANAVDGLQGLDPSLALVDEIGFQPLESWDSLMLASGKRTVSTIWGFGTPGLDRDNALFHLRSMVRGGEAVPGFVYREFAADEDCDLTDRDQWRKANPAIDAGFLQMSALETALRLSLESQFRVFHLGQWVDGIESWLGPDGRTVWRSLVDPWEFVDGAPTWVGVDVGLKRDSTAVVAVQKREDGRVHAKLRLWVPQADQPVDITDVMGHIRGLGQQYSLQAVAFDPRYFDYPAKFLSDERFPMVEIPQSVERMTSAIGNLYQLIKEGGLSHDGGLPFETQVLNAVPRLNERGFTLQKSKSRGRIDAAIALALAVDRALFAKRRAPLVVL